MVMPRYTTIASRTRAERAACPTITPNQRATWANRAAEDAQDLIVDVHDIDPRELWGRLVLWGQHDPPRLVAAAVALAAMHNPHTPGQVLAHNVHATAVGERDTAA